MTREELIKQAAERYPYPEKPCRIAKMRIDWQRAMWVDRELKKLMNERETTHTI